MSDQPTPLVQLLANLDEDAVLALVRQRIAAGDDPLQIIEECNAGLQRVGQRYEAGEYFISGLIMSGEIFREVMEIVQPLLQSPDGAPAAGKVLLGTVAGDIHDIGKNIAGMLLSCHGFTVIDLGTDVSDVEFAKKAVEIRPDIIGLSGLITASFESMKNTTTVLRTIARIYNMDFSIVVGGSILSDEVCRFIGADYWVTDVMTGIQLFQKLMKTKSRTA
ncbi:MAG TPA: cobalamin-dependent protein [Anaerolineaceae bacterium]|jgi:methanogenic corrinoid protein MtbC1